MVTHKEVEKQLKRIGFTIKFWGRPEIMELQHILIPGEQVMHCMNGRYEGGFATLVATDQRLLLIDKRIMHLFVEDIRYDMLAEVDFSSQIISASAKVCTPTKTLIFTTFRSKELRQLVSYVQQRVIEIRQQYSFQATSQGQQDTQPQQAAAYTQPADTTPVYQPQFQTPPPAQPVDEFTRQVVSENIGIVATNDATNQNQMRLLPRPKFRNPYAQGPFMTRRRVGRFSAH